MEAEASRSTRIDEGRINVDALTAEIENMLPDDESSRSIITCCIFRIETKYLAQNEKAYVPEAFFFGPYYFKDPRMESTKHIKLKYLKDLDVRTRNGNLIRKLNGAIATIYKQARQHYAGPIDLTREEFIKVLVIDGIFIVELFRKNAHKDALVGDDDPVFNVPRRLQCLYHDLILLANQIPWIVLDTLFENSITDVDVGSRLSLVVLAINFFGNLFSTTPTPIMALLGQEPNHIKHILDLLRNSLILRSRSSTSWSDHSSSLQGQRREGLPSATSLEESGIRFRTRESISILDIRFHRSDGAMEIPTLLIHENTDTLFRNLIILELYCTHYDCIITSYSMLFDNLIQGTEDMKKLCDDEVISNRLHLEDATKIFNHSYEEYACVKENYYQQLVQEVDEYRRQRHNYYIRRWQVYKRELMNTYCNHPWAVISIFVVFIMLVLTFLQTFFTIYDS